jgi:hypothetical protein
LECACSHARQGAVNHHGDTPASSSARSREWQSSAAQKYRYWRVRGRTWWYQGPATSGAESV